MEIFKTHKPCLVLFLLIFHCSSLSPGALFPAETTEEKATEQQAPAGLPEGGENMPLLASPPFPTTAINQNIPFGRPLNKQGQPFQTAYPQQQQLNYPQESLNQAFSGLNQPFSNTNQPFLGVNKPFSSSNQPFGIANQQGLEYNSNTPFDNGVSENNMFTIAIALVSLIILMANLGLLA